MFFYAKRNVLFVCIGNICRSPSAEAVLRYKAKQAKLSLRVDSAGCAVGREGQKPDLRAQRIAIERGYNFKGICARQLRVRDYKEADLILAAEQSNIDFMKMHCPPEYHFKLHLFLPYCGLALQNLPDPYYGSLRGFSHVLDLIETACDKLICRLNE